MANWCDEITLITITEEKDRTNDNGFVNAGSESKNTVFCNVKSVGYSEFYKSQQAGMYADLKADVHIADYGGELLAEYNGQRYSILKTYKLDDDTIELTLSDLRHSKAESGE